MFNGGILQGNNNSTLFRGNNNQVGGGLFGSSQNNQNNFGGGFMNTGQQNLPNFQMPSNGTLGIQIPIVKNDGKETLKFMSITAHDNFTGFSLEELRLNDMKLRKQGIIPMKVSTGGMIGNNNSTNSFNMTSQTTGGLFGSNTSQPQQTGGGVFGMSGNSLFGGNNKQGGLFGNNMMNNNNSTNQSSLFGNNTGNSNLFGGTNNVNKNLFGGNTGGGSSLFGNNMNNSVLGGTNSFGNNANKPSLFPSSTGSSLFGGAPANAGSNLFSNNIQTNTTNQGSSLFGGNTLQKNTGSMFNQSSGGLFGGSNTSGQGQGQGLFGGSNNTGQGLFGGSNTTGQGQGQGLFGGSNTSGQGLFGGSNNTGQGQGQGQGLFGGTQQGGSSLFSQNNTNQNAAAPTISNFGGIGGNTFQVAGTSTNASSGLFGGTANNNSSLFGNAFKAPGNQFTSPSNSSQTGGLFGAANKPAGTATSSLFGGATATTSGGLFGGSVSQPQNSNAQASSSLFGNSALNTPQATVTGPTQPAPQAANLFSAPGPNVGKPQTPQVTQGNHYITPGIGISNEVIDVINKQKSIENFLAELEEKYEQDNNSSLRSYGQFLSKEFSNENDNYYSGFKKYSTPRYFRSKPRTIRNLVSSEGNSVRNSMISSYGIRRSDSLHMSSISKQPPQYRLKECSNIINNDYLFQINRAEIEQKFRSEFKTRGRAEFKNNENIINSAGKNYEYKATLLGERADEIKVKVKYRKEQIEYRFKNINFSNKVIELKEAIHEKMLEDNPMKFENLLLGDMTLVVMGKVLADSKQLSEYKNNLLMSQITCMISSSFLAGCDDEMDTSLEYLKERLKDSKNIAKKEEVPKLHKSGYKTIPDYVNLCRMTADELTEVDKFTIFNEFGKVEFLGKVNLLGLDLDEIFDITKANIDIKDEGIPSLRNVRKKCTLYNMYPPVENSGDTVRDYISSFKDAVQSYGGIFVDYDSLEGKFVFEY